MPDERYWPSQPAADESLRYPITVMVPFAGLAAG